LVRELGVAIVELDPVSVGLALGGCVEDRDTITDAQDPGSAGVCDLADVALDLEERDLAGREDSIRRRRAASGLVCPAAP
jgi:hypothetical protein